MYPLKPAHPVIRGSQRSSNSINHGSRWVFRRRSRVRGWRVERAERRAASRRRRGYSLANDLCIEVR
ncbi:hypothetical protein EVAR_75176_1 [Eumeta japonica]|uniref:Uncharacterized protein n=1 Tax=Eumeta variegata TaxID=151549 RepID=A0A4C1U0K6_EUMVA|nr:hypothetical protein EVAR_75176_1 [Eumeta japonica]